jgi:phospholipid/cholesterol/gamma-HCH transport system substrate-binding protein
MRRRTVRGAALGAAAALLLTGCDFSVSDLPLPGGADVGDDPYRVTAEFRDVLDLVPQSAVKVDDISVGRVEDITVDGYSAEVTLLIKDDVELPANAVAEIRQTSLLGEKFVSLEPPPANPSSELLADGDEIGLDRTGRNVEVEEVLSALSLILNGGGVGQLKSITQELNKAFTGREDVVKSVLDQLRIFMTQLDGRKDDIVRAIEQVNSLSVELNEHTDDLDFALEELPSAISAVDKQREDLIKMLDALSELSSVATGVIKASKAGTVDSLNALAPILTELAKSGTDLADSLQIFLTFPFIDGVVGKNAQQARDLHMGDYTNLSMVLELDLRNGLPAIGNPEGGPGTPEIPLPDIPLPSLPVPTVGVPGSGGGGGGGGPQLPDLPGLGRAPVGAQQQSDDDRTRAVDTDLAAMLLWGVMGE